MASRAKIFGLIALMGFVAGIIAQLCATFVIPWFVGIIPLLGSAATYLISGVAGAVLTVALVSVWAYMTGRKDQY